MKEQQENFLRGLSIKIIPPKYDFFFLFEDYRLSSEKIPVTVKPFLGSSCPFLHVPVCAFPVCTREPFVVWKHSF